MERRWIKEMGRNRKPVVKDKDQKKSRDTEEFTGMMMMMMMIEMLVAWSMVEESKR